MAITSGISHALSGLLGILLSAYISAHSGLVKNLTEFVGNYVYQLATVPLDPTVIGLVIMTTMLSFFWGVAYHLGRHN